MSTYEGKCFCGAVKLETAGAPVKMGYCHCESCRSWSAGPVNAFTLWPKDKVKVTQGEELLGKFNKTEGSGRMWCTKCGGHVMTEHPGMGLYDVYAATIPALEFKPECHFCYEETVVPIKDGLPKHKGFGPETVDE
ncbi:Mss4-like protein [Hyaloraphidium curvatum]|nr:Mss4-like protein [Hyaloraphidium curvatum]